MNIRHTFLFYSRSLFVLTAVLLCGAAVFGQQDDKPKSRDIVPVFDTARPPGASGTGKAEKPSNPNKKPTATGSNKTKKKPIYRRKSTRVNSGTIAKKDRPNKRRPPTKTTQPDIPETRAAQIGVTLWKLSETNRKNDALSENTDDGSRFLLPERVSIDTLFEPYDLVRLAFESSRRGYLYIIDQEMYADGTLGDAYLVFPNKRIRGGVNLVAPGKPVEIPDLKGNPFYFELRPQNQNGDSLTAEILTVIITDKPIAGLKIGEIPTLVDDKTLASWRTKWSGRAEIFESDENDTNYTENEKNAGNGNATLTADDALPQTVFLVEANANGGSLITVPLWYGDN